MAVNINEKVNRMLGKGEGESRVKSKVSDMYNPFLDKSGNLIIPYINYQKVLDNGNVSAKAKEFIQKAKLRNRFYLLRSFLIMFVYLCSK